MSQVDEAVLDLTVGEASFLADVLGVAPPPGLVDPDDDDRVVLFDELITDEEGDGAGHTLPGPTITKVAEVVAPGLIERRLVDREGTIAAPVADLLTVAGSPHLVARACYEVGGIVDVRAFTSRPEMAVEQRALTDGRVRFTPFDPTTLVDRIMAFVLPSPGSLGGDSAEPAGPIELVDSALTVECATTTVEALFSPDISPAAAVGLLVADGVSTDAAERLVAASTSIASTGSVTLLLRPVDGALHGVKLAWMDAADHGVWLNEPSSNPGRRVIERVPRAHVSMKLGELLPAD